MGRPRKQWTSIQIKALIDMRQAGLPWRDIGYRLGKPHPVCSRYWREVMCRPGGRAMSKKKIMCGHSYYPLNEDFSHSATMWSCVVGGERFETCDRQEAKRWIKDGFAVCAGDPA